MQILENRKSVDQLKDATMKLTTQFLESKRTAIGPDWRSQLAKEVYNCNFRIAGCNDVGLRDFISYLSALDRPGGENSAAAAYPAIAAALVIDNNATLVAQLKIMVLGRLDMTEICGRTKLEAEAVAVWKAIFFDVGNDLAASSWIVQHVITPEREAGHLDLAGKLNLALRGGPNAARLALSLDEGLPVAKAARLEREELQLALKKEQALNMPVTSPEEGLRWFKLNLQRELAEQRLALDRQKFEVYCAQQQRLQAQRERQVAEKTEQRALKARQQTERNDQLQKERDLRAASSPLAQLPWPKSSAKVASGELPAAIRLVYPADNQEKVAAASNVQVAGTFPVSPPGRTQTPPRLSA
jgi:hypothetical protein